MTSIAVAIRSVLDAADPRDKVMCARAVARDWRAGRLAHSFDVSMPEPAELARDPARAFHAPRFRYPEEGGPGQMVRYTERFDYDKLRQILFVAMEFHPMRGGESWMTGWSRSSRTGR